MSNLFLGLSTDYCTFHAKKWQHAITGGLKATSRRQLESEAAVPPLRAHTARLQLQARTRMEASGVQTEIRDACDRLKRQLAQRPGRRRRTHVSPGQARHRWAKSILWPQRALESTKGCLGLPPWADRHPSVTPPPGAPPPPPPPPTDCLARPPAGRTVVLGTMARTPRRPPTTNPATGPRSRRGRQLEV